MLKEIRYKVSSGNDLLNWSINWLFVTDKPGQIFQAYSGQEQVQKCLQITEMRKATGQMFLVVVAIPLLYIEI